MAPLFALLAPLLLHLCLVRTGRGERADGTADDMAALRRACRQNPTWRPPPPPASDDGTDEHRTDGTTDGQFRAPVQADTPTHHPKQAFGRHLPHHMQSQQFSGDGIIEISRTACAAALDWTPRSDLWDGPYRNFWDGGYLTKENEEIMRECVDDAVVSLAEEAETNGEEEEEEDFREEPGVKGAHPPPSQADTRGPLLVHLTHALNLAEVRALRALKNCVATHFELRHEYRPFEMSYGGNEVTYVSAFVQMFVPGVAARVTELASVAAEAAGWYEEDSSDDSEDESASGDPRDPKSLGIRTSEYLRYQGGESLGNHADSGSVYTVLIALSGADEYEGGEFFLETSLRNDGGENGEGDPDKLYFKPDRLEALVFLSETGHGVTKITDGTREMFTNELWEFADAPFDMLRGSPEEWEDRYRRALATVEDRYRGSSDDDEDWDDDDGDDDGPSTGPVAGEANTVAPQAATSSAVAAAANAAAAAAKAAAAAAEAAAAAAAAVAAIAAAETATE